MFHQIDTKLIPLILTVLLVLPCHSGSPTVEVDTLYSNQSLHDGQFLGLANGTLRLGFFAPDKSSENRYLGIRLNYSSHFFGRRPNRDDSSTEYMWVANRDDPLTNTAGVLKFDEVTSNLVLVDTSTSRSLWWTNCTIGSTRNVTAKLQGHGSFVLQNSEGEEIWSSFDDLTNVFLPGAEMSFDLRTKKKNTLTSWKSKWDPSSGPFRFDILLDSTKLPRAYVFKGSKPYFRLGPWIGDSFICVPDLPSTGLYKYHLYVNPAENEDAIRFTFSFHYGIVIVPKLLTLGTDGHLVHSWWDEGSGHWNHWEKPKHDCDSYGFCGKFATCNRYNVPICKCMDGFKPQSRADWDKHNFSGGCVREKKLACNWNAANNLTSGDTFKRSKYLKLPEGGSLRDATKESQCRNLCGEDCKCLAYAFVKKQHCLVWKEDLLDMSVIEDGQDLYFKRNPSNDSSTGKPKKKKPNVILISTVPVVVGVIIILCFITLLWRRHIRRKAASNEEDECITTEPSEEDQELGDIFSSPRPETGDMEFRQYGLRIIRTATGDFNEGNKLGEGGFGPVYKGILSGGQEIAVKRLSKRSTQGVKEFKNEVLLISKLQHQNLVRLLGYCAKVDEKLLIYEFLPNGTLDAYLFGELKEKLQDWSKRFQIIEGIGRGILYLHRDSRLKVIHRDLKASNILLDEHLKPKISDFGTARIFGANQMLETNTVIGTLGYMAPEYMMHGHFSEKSDVYSFGVLLLEIVSSSRVGTFYDERNSLNLLGHTWKLWEEGNAFDLIDEKLRHSWPHSNALKCINVALLCLQLRASDRPSMSNVLAMLTMENLDDLPSPREPPFIPTRDHMNSSSLEINNPASSQNLLTVTDLEGR